MEVEEDGTDENDDDNARERETEVLCFDVECLLSRSIVSALSGACLRHRLP